MNSGPANIPKATPASFHTMPGAFNGNGFTRNAGAAAMSVGRGVVAGAKLIGSGVKAFGKAAIGQDDFTKQVSAQAKAGRGKY